MRKFAVQYGLACAVLWIILKMAVFFAGNAIDWFDFTVMANNFFLLTAVSLSIFMYKKHQKFQEVPRLEDIKMGIFGGMIYTVAIVFFSYFYNAKIDDSVLEDRIEQRVSQIAKAIDSEEDFATYKKVNSEAAGYSRVQILERERESTRSFLNPRVSALLLMMFFTLLTIFYAFFITVVIRKIYIPGLKRAQ